MIKKPFSTEWFFVEELISVVVWFIRAIFICMDIAWLYIWEYRKLCSDSLEVQSSHFFIKVLGKSINSDWIEFCFCPELNLCKSLIGETRRHHKWWMPGSTSEIHESSFGEEDNLIPIRKEDVINLRFDIFPLIFSHTDDIDFGIEVSDITYDCLISHFYHMVMSDDISISSCGDKYICLIASRFHRHNPEAFHSSLKRTDRIDFCYPNSGSHPLKCGSTSLSDISVSTDNDDFSCNHHIGGSLNSVDNRFTASIEVVEFCLCYRIIHIDSWEGKSPLAIHLVEAMDSGCCLLRNPLYIFLNIRVECWISFQCFFDRSKKNSFFLAGRIGKDTNILLSFTSKDDKKCGITSIIEDHIWSSTIWPLKESMCIVPVLFKRFSLIRKYRSSWLDYGCCSMILSREDITTDPSDIRSEFSKGFDEHSRLDRHMKWSCNSSSLKGFTRSVFFSKCHESRHFSFRNRELFSPPSRKGHICYFVIHRKIMND